MQAMVMTTVGGPEVLQLQQVAKPPLTRDTELLVRLKAAGVNPVDTKMRSKAGYPFKPPAILGCDGAGIVEEIGKAVSGFEVGHEVYFCRCPSAARMGNYAQYALVDQRLVAKKPTSLSFEEAAAIPLVLITAWESLHDRAQMKAGQDVLIHAGAGGVGHIAIQLAKLAGARVSTTVGSEEKAEFVEALGVDARILYKNTDFVRSVLDWTDGRGVDIALDTVGGETFERTFGATRYYGDVVTLLQPGPSVNWTTARERNLRVSFELMLTPFFFELAAAQRHQGDILRLGARLVDEGKLKVRVAEILPLGDAASAHRRLQSGPITGKIVLSIP